MAATAANLILKFGSDYPVNGSNKKGVEVNATGQLRSQGLITSDERVFYFSGAVIVGDFVTINGSDWYVSKSEAKRATNVDVIYRVVISK